MKYIFSGIHLQIYNVVCFFGKMAFNLLQFMLKENTRINTLFWYILCNIQNVYEWFGEAIYKYSHEGEFNSRKFTNLKENKKM